MKLYLYTMNIILFLVTLILGILIHYGVQRVFIIYRKFDDYNHRSSHNTLATRTGGISVFTVVLLISIFYYIKGVEVFDYSLLIPLGIMFIVGVYDDFYNADFKLKFFLQIIVAKILIDQGFVISNYFGLFGVHEVPRILAQLSTIFVFLVVINAINFIDGIDGLAISQVIKTLALFELFSISDSEISVLGLLIIGALLPLYYFNFKKKKKIFLGDGGSLLLGTIVMIYVLSILSGNYQFKPGLSVNKTLFSILIILYPLIDLLRVFILRIKAGKSPFIADNNHIHHKFLNVFQGSHLKSLCSIMIIELIVVGLLAKSFIN